MRSIRELRNVCIACLVLGAIAPAMAAAQMNSPKHGGSAAAGSTDKKEFTFEVVSIRPLKPEFSPYDGAPAPVGNEVPTASGFSTTMVPGMLLQLAYDNTHIENMPAWFSTWYFVNARVATKDMAEWQKQSSRHELLRLALQSMLRERFKLAFHLRPVGSPEYHLLVQKKGIRFKPSVSGAVLPQGLRLPSGGVRTLDLSGRQIIRMHFFNATIGDLVDVLKGASPERPVRDMTGLTGHYDFTLEPQTGPRPEDSVFTYPVDSLGLQLKAVTAPSSALVIDHVEKPSAN